ncbi:MAG: endonuclease/exonuclease/phosphatase family protein [Anaerolineaceae bacterium]
MAFKEGREAEMLKLRIMTLNLGGGVKNFTGASTGAVGKYAALIQLITEINPDVLAVQEIAQHVDADGIRHSMVDQIRLGGQFSYSFYGETLSMKKHMQVKKDLMVNGLFSDWWDWSKGNAIFSRLSFSRLGDCQHEGVPRNVPIYQPLVYEGSRDTDPRYVILTRIKQAPYPYLVNLHLTTLVGERGVNPWPEIVNTAKLTRAQQVAIILGMLEEHVLIPELPLILMGDFNADAEEYALKDILEEKRHFTRLVPENNLPTHASAGMVDHFFFFPVSRLVSYQCRVVSDGLANQISDHLPVVADLVIE